MIHFRNVEILREDPKALKTNSTVGVEKVQIFSEEKICPGRVSNTRGRSRSDISNIIGKFCKIYLFSIIHAISEYPV